MIYGLLLAVFGFVWAFAGMILGSCRISLGI